MSEETHFQQMESCAACDRELRDTYYLVNGAMVCSECQMQLASAQPAGSGLGRFTRAIGFGVVGGAIGAGIYFGILKLTGYEVGLVAIVVGFLVGAGVRIGTGGHGGWLYQLLAVGITYAAIVTTYVPFIVEDLNHAIAQEALALAEEVEVPRVQILADQSLWLNGSQVSADQLRTQLQAASASTPAVWYYREGRGTEAPPPIAEEVANAIDDLGLERMNFTDAAFTRPMTVMDGMAAADPSAQVFMGGVLFFLAAALPFLGLPETLIGLAIIGFALYQAGSMNRREKLEIEGPLELEQPG